MNQALALYTDPRNTARQALADAARTWASNNLGY